MTDPPRCWNCGKKFFEVESIKGEAVINKECPRCHKRNRIVLGEEQPA